jgi:hypothetical protein
MSRLDPFVGNQTLTNWQQIVGKPNARCDPYLIWFDLTFKRDEKSVPRAAPAIDVLVELLGDKELTTQSAKDTLQSLRDWGFKPRAAAVVHNKVQRFITGSLPLTTIKPLSLLIAEKSLNAQFELASARFISTADHLVPPQQHLGTKIKKLINGVSSKLSPVRKGWVENSGRWQLFAQTVKDRQSVPAQRPPLVVVIDDFCNFASRTLQSQIRSIWYQGLGGNGDVAMTAPAVREIGGSKPVPQSGEDSNPFGEDYGAILWRREPGDADGQSLKADPAPLTDESSAYLFARPARPRPPPVWSHGSAVLSLLTSKRHPALCDGPDGINHLLRPADIDFVQLPNATVVDTSGGSLAGYALDAIHRAVRLAAHEQRPAVIVNMSYGTHSGPHDGSSMFERAMLEMLELYDGKEVTIPGHSKVKLPVLHIVLPAGNTHVERTHATAWLHASEPPQKLYWNILPDTETDSFVEIWIGDDYKSNVEIRVTPPSGKQEDSQWVSAGKALKGEEEFSDGSPKKVLRSAVIYPKSTSRGSHGRLALVAVAPTQQRANYGVGEQYITGTDGPPPLDSDGNPKGALSRLAMQAEPGCWTIELRNLNSQAVMFHAWIQRHDSAPGRSRSAKGYQGRQSYFVEAPTTSVDPCFTLNGIATASMPGRLWVVGAMDERCQLQRYSAAGPDRVFGNRIEGPDVVTVVDRSRNVPGRHVSGVFSGSRLRVAGTSIAAAVFTRMLYDTLSRKGAMAWCPPDCSPPKIETFAGEPAMADPRVRGIFNRLRWARDIAISCLAPRPQDPPCR